MGAGRGLGQVLGWAACRAPGCESPQSRRVVHGRKTSSGGMPRRHEPPPAPLPPADLPQQQAHIGDHDAGEAPPRQRAAPLLHEHALRAGEGRAGGREGVGSVGKREPALWESARETRDPVRPRSAAARQLHLVVRQAGHVAARKPAPSGAALEEGSRWQGGRLG